MSFEELAENLFLIEVPLPGNPLRCLNAYLLRADSRAPGWRGRSLLIDNGFNRPECLEALLEALKALGVNPQTLDLFITHLHSDHCGLTGKLLDLAGKQAWVFAGAGDAAHINMFSRQSFRPAYNSGNMLLGGMPAEIVQGMTTAHPGIRYATDGPCPFTPVREGDVLPYGRYNLEVLEMPGHTPGLLCLYDRERKLFFSSDHILGDITPNITIWEGVEDPLGDYLKSLNKAKKLEVELCLTGHRSILSDCRGRIAALEKHHAGRLREVLGILAESGETSVYDIAAKMTWAIRAKSWDDFPDPQKWFACGESFAHLKHLLSLGSVAARTCDGKILFSLADR